MITNTQTNTVFYSEYLKSYFNKEFKNLQAILAKHQVDFLEIKATADYWCRDYMPIQLEENKFVQFRYEPSYLKHQKEFQSDTKLICKENNIKASPCEINLDGGNIVYCKNKAIISDRVFDENPEYSNKLKLVKEIEQELGVEVIIIPQIKGDYTGHADGMLRFVDENTVLGNNRNQEEKTWSKKLNAILNKHNINYIDIPFFEDYSTKNSAIGVYVNYLDVGNLIILPIFETKNNKDQEVINLFRKIFPNRIIETINYNKIAKNGGLLNCTTWNVYINDKNLWLNQN